MLLGTHTPRLDEKGRLILPARFREELDQGLVITKGQERCLVVWTRAGFQAYAAHLTTGSPTDGRVRNYTRILFASAYPDTPDKQGRVTIPTALRDYAGLTRDCAVIGAQDHLEIWDLAAWESFLATNEPAFVEMDGEVVPMR